MTSTTRVEATKNTPRRTLDDLAGLDCDALRALYGKGTVSALDALDGNPTGRMLAVRGLERSPLAPQLRRLAASSSFPWGGKSFASETEARGLGVNRVLLAGKHKLFPFVTTFAPSMLDGGPSIRLNYDLPENPSVIRHIHDEVREVDAGLFLGPAMWRSGPSPSEHHFVLWFALDTQRPAAPFGWG